jgi:hypothetical protein
VGWLLLVVALCAIALNPAVPSVPYAFFWLGVLALARGAAILVPWLAVAIDVALLMVCFFGLGIGGLFLVPSIVCFTLADATRRDQATLA